MSLFKHHPRAPQRLLPPEAPHHLAAYGYHVFHGTVDTLSGAEAAFVDQLRELARDDPAHLVAEMKVVAVAAGGWAAYGAGQAVRAFAPSEADSEDGTALRDAGFVHLHSLRLPDLAAHLSEADRAAYHHLYPADPLKE